MGIVVSRKTNKHLTDPRLRFRWEQVVVRGFRVIRQLHLIAGNSCRRTFVDSLRNGGKIVLGVCLVVALLILLGVRTCVASGSNLLNAVTDFGADPTGAKDSTQQFQSLFDQIPNGWQGYI